MPVLWIFLSLEENQRKTRKNHPGKLHALGRIDCNRYQVACQDKTGNKRGSNARQEGKKSLTQKK
jgi:hypothetical protein